ncbi:hypothetical protein L195_g042485, partial [Trifolium pratense]
DDWIVAMFGFASARTSTTLDAMSFDMKLTIRNSSYSRSQGTSRGRKESWLNVERKFLLFVDAPE